MNEEPKNSCYISKQDYERLMAQGKRLDMERLLEYEIGKFNEKKERNGTIKVLNEYSKIINEDIKEEKEEEKEKVVLPKEGKLISAFINQISPILSKKNVLFYRRDIRQIVEVGKVKHKKEEEKFFTGFIPIKPSRFITLVEKFFVPGLEVYSNKAGMFISEFHQKSMTKELASTVLESYILEEDLNPIDRIFTIPMPIIYNKELTFPKIGYDERFNSWLIPSSPRISNTKINLKESKEVIHSLLKEFCFQSNEDYNMAIAGLITPFLRGLYTSFNSRTPVFIYKGNRERVGKDYLAGINGLIYEGVALEEPPINNAENRGNSNEELRKKILSAFISGRKRVHFSNNKGYINNAVFESVITASTYSDRILGKNESPIFENELEFSLSGNVGIGLTPDLANRSRIINLFFDKEDANSRIFKRPNLHKWVLDNRELVLSSIYGLIKNWFEKGCPESKFKFASFPEWARVCGGIMEAAGYESPCKNTLKNIEVGMDSETRDMKLLFEICYEKRANLPLSKHDIKGLIESEEIFNYFDFDKKSDQVRFGTKINKFVGRILSDIKMKVIDENVRASRQKYVFTKEIKSYDEKLIDLNSEGVDFVGGVDLNSEIVDLNSEGVDFVGGVDLNSDGVDFVGGVDLNSEIVDLNSEGVDLNKKLTNLEIKGGDLNKKDNKESGNLGNLGNLVHTSLQRHNNLYKGIGDTLPTLPRLPHLDEKEDNFDENEIKIVKIKDLEKKDGNLGNLKEVVLKNKEVDFSELDLGKDKQNGEFKNG